MERVYAAIDLKSFYASVECHERGLDPLTTNLVVADKSRTNKTICLAVSPSLKAYGLSGRARLFEVEQKVRAINTERKSKTTLGIFLGSSHNTTELAKNPNLKLDYIVATPRMQYYLDYSSKIYGIYLRHVAPDDIFSYSIDEIFCDITSYLKLKKCTAAEFVTQMIADVYQATGITATAGIGNNLFLAKVAMDILAKHTEPNSSGVRIAELNEQTFREQLWHHQPITDFWRVGPGYARRLAKHNLLTMGDIARCSLTHEDLLYQTFGVNAELLIDHSWGYEPVTIADIKHHQPRYHSLSSGQVLSRPYSFTETRTIIKEMADELALELTEKSILANQLSLEIHYDSSNSAHLTTLDHYGRSVPKPVRGSIKLATLTASSTYITQQLLKLYDAKSSPELSVRRVYVGADLIDDQKNPSSIILQADLFTDYTKLDQLEKAHAAALANEARLQKSILKIRKRYGKNAILRGTSFEAEATGRSRHHQIGGHRA